MPRHIRLDISPATATHCGEVGAACRCTDCWGKCRAFGRKSLPYDESADQLRRLPQCLAAEKGASE